MNAEDIIRMALEAGIDGVIQTSSGRSVALDMHKIERLVQAAYAAGAAAEREACAEICDTYDAMLLDDEGEHMTGLGDKIRNRKD